MMRIWMAGFWLATVWPLAAMLVWAWPALAKRWGAARPLARWALVGIWLAGAGFLVARPHDDSFTGLDNMTYRNLAHAFLDGRGFRDPDVVLAGVPVELRENFLLHRGPEGRPTRDRVFMLSGFQATETQPFFMPTLALAAAGPDPVLAPERFVPMIGALWLALVLAAGFCAGGGWGLAAASALVVGTAWPAWFLRGFYAEGVGACLAAGVVAADAIRPLRRRMAVPAGFALGMAVTYHPTLIVVAGPLALGWMVARRDRIHAVALGLGTLAGLFPFWALTRWVCQPYGDWTRWGKLLDLIMLAPEHRALALATGVVVLAIPAGLWVGFRPPVRRWIRRMDEWATPFGWLAVCAAPVLVLAVCPGGVGAVLRAGAGAVWSGIRWPFALLALVGCGGIWMRGRPLRDRFMLGMLCWGALLFVFLKGVEIPVGLWSQRRFLPVALTGIALLAAPLSAGLAALSRRSWRWPATVFLIGAGLANPVRWPAAYLTINERGATAWTQQVAQQCMGTNRWVIFDYYPHSVPYAADLDNRVLGIGEPARGYWPQIAAWLRQVAQTNEIWLATSWSPTAMEEGAKLEEVESVTGRFPVVHANDFFPAERGVREVKHSFFRWIPIATSEQVHQDKTMDGSPFALRGPWGPVKQGATWSRQTSQIFGPIPPPGESVEFIAECGWPAPGPDWPQQILQVHPPWAFVTTRSSAGEWIAGVDLRLAVPTGNHTLQGLLTRPEDDETRPATGLYTLAVDRPFAPAAYNLRGYTNDLGVLIRRIIIQVESNRPSMSD